MFICDECGETSRPGEKSYTVVRETRDHIFPFRVDAHSFRQNGKIEHRNDNGGTGKQIVKEERVCGRCSIEYPEAPVKKGAY